MNICIICNEYPLMTKGGGIGVFTEVLAKYLIQNKNNVTVIGIYKNIKNKKIINDGLIKVICLPFYNIPKFSWEFNRWLLCRSIEKEHRKQKFDIVEFPDYQGWLRKLNLDIPILIRLNAPEKVGLHDGVELDNLSFSIKSEAKSIPFANYIIGSSLSVIKAAKDTYVESLSDYQKIELIYNGIALPEKINNSISSKSTGKLVLFAGRLIEKKGVYDLVRSWKNVSNKHEDYELMIVGRDGKNNTGKSVLAELKKIIYEESIKNIIFKDQISIEQLRKLFMVAEICVFPSHSEAFSMVVLDALAHGKPTIYSKIGPGYEIIEPGVNGLLCDPKNPDSLEKCILDLIENQNLKKMFSKNSLKTIKNKFSIEITGKQNLLFYSQCIEDYRKN